MASVDELKKLVSRLESRIEQLESKITGHGAGSASGDGMRMVIMGPPGAGMHSIYNFSGALSPTAMLTMDRQGNTGSTYQGQVLHLPSCKYLIGKDEREG